jgi:hypothetical protein
MDWSQGARLAVPEADRNHPQEQPEPLTAVKARQGAGPRDMVVVLTVSTALAAVAGVALLAYFLS